MTDDRIVAVGLLTRNNLKMFGDDLRKVYPIEDAPCFSELLRAIDDADQQHWREEDRIAALQRLRDSG